MPRHLAGLGPDDGAAATPVPGAGFYPLPYAEEGAPLAVIVFYRSHLLAGDLAPVEALAEALSGRGFAVRAVHVSSLKDPAAAGFVEAALRGLGPAVVLNATGFSARRGEGGSPLDAAGVPVLQLVLAVGGIEAWQAGFRGLSQTDLAMQVVLPELDGRLLSTAISFKAEAEPQAGLEFAPSFNRPHPAGVALAADRAAGWARLAGTKRAERRVAVVLSDYPGAGGQVAHAVGLDSFASLAAILDRLRDGGYATGEARPDGAGLAALLCDAPAAPILDLPGYRALFAKLPLAAQARVLAAWGEPEEDPALAENHFTLRHHRLGSLLLAVQPDRGQSAGPQSQLSRCRTAAPSRLYRVLSVAARGRAGARHRASGNAWHAGMAARQGGGAVRWLFPGRADRWPAGDLSVHRQQPRARPPPPSAGWGR